MDSLVTFQGNWIDLVIIGILLFYLLEGIRRGFIFGLIDLGGFIISFFAALKTYSVAAGFLMDYFSFPRGIASATGFFLVGFLSELVYSFAVSFFYRKYFPQVVKTVQDRNKLKITLFLNRLFGIIPSLGEAFIFIAFIMTLLIILPIDGGIKQNVVTSKIGGRLLLNTQLIESQLNAIFGQAVNETLTFITVTPNAGTEERIDLHFTQTNVRVDETAEASMLNLVNTERTKAGLTPLVMSEPLRELARRYGKDMFARGYFSHYSPEGLSAFDRMDNAGINFIIGGENLALAPNVQLAHQGLMNSEGHRANILSRDYRRVGIGVIDGGIYGMMFVQEFTD